MSLSVSVSLSLSVCLSACLSVSLNLSCCLHCCRCCYNCRRCRRRRRCYCSLRHLFLCLLLLLPFNISNFHLLSNKCSRIQGKWLSRQAGHVGGKPSKVVCVSLGRTEVLGSSIHSLRTQSQGRQTIDCLQERCVQRGSG